MVTRSVILVTASEAAAFDAAATAAAADSIISNAPFEQNSTEELQTNLFDYPSYTKRAQHTSPIGLVQLCRHKGCFHAVDFERRGGLCCIHQKGPMDGEQNDSEDSEDDRKILPCSLSVRESIKDVTGDERLCDTHSTQGSDYCLDDDEVGKKRDRPSEDSISGKDDIKRQRVDTFAVDLTGVPPQPPIPKIAGNIKEGASKYKGVSFCKQKNKWQAQISIEGKERNIIGYYENEEEAAVDYARAVFKYRGQGPLDKVRERRALDKSRELKSFVIDLTGVPPQPPVPKVERRIKGGASKYTGVYFNKPMKKWLSQIKIDGMNRHIGYYDNEEEAAADYARAVFKYKGQGALDKAREHRARDISSERKSIIIDLSDVPPQPPIPKSAGRIKEGASKYTGVTFSKQKNKWLAKIRIDGKQRHIGYYENEEEAAADYARAVFKYEGQGALDKARKRKALDKAMEHNLIFDLSDVPPQSPLPKSAGRVKEVASKYKGISFNKQTNKWHAQIMIAGKPRFIGSYEIEEEAAVDYARAVFKFNGQGALDKARERRARDKSGEGNSFIIDLSDAPPQSPIPKSAGHIKEGASKYKGVSFCKQKNKWQAQISIEGKQRHIGCYESEEDAAVDYARAVFKYKGQRRGALEERRAQDTSSLGNSFIIDLTDVPPQPPIPKSSGSIKEGASKYTGVSFSKQMKKWQAQIRINGKVRHIGYYENEEEAAAIDYARAVFKYKGQGALDKARERSSR